MSTPETHRAGGPAHLYFAYGSNLNVEGMAERCPEARPLSTGELEGWRLTFQGVADVEPCEGERAHGGLWLISDRDLESLDRYENHPRIYRRDHQRVLTAEGELEAIAYLMNEHYVGLPSPEYYRTIERGYQQWGLPLVELEAALARVRRRLRAAGITGFERDGDKRLRPADR